MAKEKNLKIFICPVCGGNEFQSAGDGTYKCRCCNAVLRDEEESAQLLNDAKVVFDFIDASNFEAAEEICRNRLNYASDNAELHWLLFLARNKIKFVVDPVTKERKPVFYSKNFFTFTRDCVLKDEDYLAALHGNNAEYYRQLGQKIEDVRLELCENMAQNPDFEKVDVFISFKSTETLTDSDGNETEKPTEDSVIAAQVYKALTKLGYKVFFSPESIGKGKIEGEKYEPKIFAALASCKAMVLVGTKSSYVNSAWVRNEWSRYLYFMDRASSFGNSTVGKQDGTLFYMYGNVLPKGLPWQIAERQGISCGTNNPHYVEMVCQQIAQKINPSESKSRIHIAPTKKAEVGAKAINDGVVKRAVVIAEQSSLKIDDDKKLSAAKGALAGDDYKTAEKFVCDVLAESPHNCTALLVKLLAKCRVKNVTTVVSSDKLTDDFPLLSDNILYGKEDVSKRLSKALTERMVKAFSVSHDYVSLLKWLDLPVGHEFDGRKAMFDDVLAAAYKTDFGVRTGAVAPHEAVCDKLLKCFDSDEVAPYIDCCKKFAEQMIAAKMFESAKKMYALAAAADPSDPECKWLVLWCGSRYAMIDEVYCNVEVFEAKAMEEILAVCTSTEQQFGYISRTLDLFVTNANNFVKNDYVGDFANSKKAKSRNEVVKNQLNITAKALDGVAQYVDKANDQRLAAKLSQFADVCRKGGEFDLAKTYYNSALKLDYRTAEVYWGLLLAELRCENDNRLNDVDTPVDSVENGNLYANVLAAATAEGTTSKYTLAKKQQSYAIRIRKELAAIVKAKRKKKIIVTVVVAIAVLLVVAAALCVVYYVFPSVLPNIFTSSGCVDGRGQLSCLNNNLDLFVGNCVQLLSVGKAL